LFVSVLSLQALLSQAGSGGGEAETVVGCSSLPQDAAAAAETVDVGDWIMQLGGRSQLHCGRWRGIAG
jgi:hypothetical protein